MKCSAVNTLHKSLLALLWVGIAASVEVDLRKGSASSLPTGMTWHSPLTQSTGSCKCDRQGVLKLTFDPESRVRAQINLTFEHSTGVTFTVGDSRTNHARAGDRQTQSNDAVVYAINNSISFAGRDMPTATGTGFSYGVIHTTQDFVAMQPYTTLTLNVQDQLATAHNGQTYLFIDSYKLFQLNGQVDYEQGGGINYDLYLSMNRAVDSLSQSFQSGSGLCRAEVQFFNTKL